MKKRLLIIALVLSAVGLSGCKGMSEIMNDDGFVLIKEGYPLSFYYNENTKVIYMNDERSYGGGWTVLLNSDGTPLLYGEGTSG